MIKIQFNESILIYKYYLEPLIDPIARNPNVTTVPIVEVIDDNTFNIHG